MPLDKIYLKMCLWGRGTEQRQNGLKTVDIKSRKKSLDRKVWAKVFKEPNTVAKTYWKRFYNYNIA
jgi:hypothetical protein